MKRIALSFLLFIMIIPLFGIEVKIFPDKDTNITISILEKNALKKFVKSTMNFELLDEGAYKIAKENRALANEYLKQKKLSSYDIARIKTEIEMYLANHFIEDIQKNVKIPEKILMSYYLDNKNKFKKVDEASIVLIFFNNYDNAAKFYENVKNRDYPYAKTLANEYNATIKEYGFKKITKLKSPAKDYLLQFKKAGIFLPPVVLSPNTVSILYVKKYKIGKGYQDFEDVKEDIRKFLYNKTFLRERNKILRKYGIKYGIDNE